MFRIQFFFHVQFLLILHLHSHGIVKIFPFVVRIILPFEFISIDFHLDNHETNTYLHLNGSLEIRKLQATDSDQYLCTATNPAGTMTYSVQLNVNGKDIFFRNDFNLSGLFSFSLKFHRG